MENIRALDIVVNPIDDEGAEAVDGALDHARFRARGFPTGADEDIPGGEMMDDEAE